MKFFERHGSSRDTSQSAEIASRPVIRDVTAVRHVLESLERHRAADQFNDITEVTLNDYGQAALGKPIEFPNGFLHALEASQVITNRE
ncbi:hypothetical protein H7097_02145 [Aeromicrobium sp.]|nr:hypothetical protein [Candidatus Saccharibacteria bacterium]